MRSMSCLARHRALTGGRERGRSAVQQRCATAPRVPLFVIGGGRTKLHVAHMKLSHSGVFLLRAYPLQSREMLFDANSHGPRVFGGVPDSGNLRQ